MNLSDMISRRKSVRSYTNERIDAATMEKIGAFIDGARRLYPGIGFAWRMLDREQVKCICPWTTPQCIAIYAPDMPGALENVGFVFQQLDLYLASIGLGACWLGLGRPTREMGRLDGMKCVMMMAIGHPKGAGLRSGSGDFKRKSMGEISDAEDPRLEGARLAPSSVNSQPWRFTHEGDVIHAHCARGALSIALSDMNRIDMGICLAHAYVSNPEKFEFFRAEGIASPRGCTYIGSIRM